MIDIVCFNDLYIQEIDETELSYWGKWGSTSIKGSSYDLFLIALVDGNYAGHLYGNFIGDLFYFDVILIKEEYRNQGVGSKLLSGTINILKEKNFKSILTTAEHLKMVKHY